MNEWMKESAELKKTHAALAKVIFTQDMDLVRNTDDVFWRLYNWCVYLSNNNNCFSPAPTKEKRMDI